MSEFLQAPYRFVPLSRFVLRPDWASKVSHDHPFSDGLSGELEITLIAQTDLCVGGEQMPATEQAPGRVNFYRTPGQKLAIPGSSFKGMLRNVLEIACFGHFRQVENQRLGVRDISTADNFYSRAMNRSKVFTGWLKFVEGKWQITPCSYVRIKQEDLIKHVGIDKDKWIKAKSAKQRYQLLNGLRRLQFDIEPYQYDCKQQATALGQGKHEGLLVVTGQPGASFEQNGGKKREFVFFNPQPNETLAVPDKAIQAFMQIHAESAEWKYWLSQLKTLEQGVPVFFHKDEQKQIKSIGLSRMYKLAYEHSLHDSIAHTSSEHLQSSQPDLAGLLFGWLDEQDSGGKNNLRGRVQPGLLALSSDHEPQWQKATVLSNPKPTFYPAYIHQPTDKGAFKTLMDANAELAGWKRYPLQDKSVLPQLESNVVLNNKVQVQLESLPIDSQFTGKMRFHNLRTIELGALLWALDFNNTQYAHNLGMGKPYGFGQVRLQVTSSRLRTNSAKLRDIPEDLTLQTARTAFIHYMNHCWRQATGDGEAQWQKSPQVTALLAMASPDGYKRENLSYYSTPKKYMDAKKSELRFAANHQIEKAKLLSTLPSRVAENPDITLDDLLTEATETLAEQQRENQASKEKAQRQAARAAMSEEEQQMDKLDELLSKADGEFTKSEIDNTLPKSLNQLNLEAASWTPEEKARVRELGMKAAALADRLGKTDVRLGKAAKKILRDYP